MKLLFDEQLSPRLVRTLVGHFPGSTHVQEVGLGSADDRAIWLHARDHSFAIVTRDVETLQRLESDAELGVLVLG